MDRKEEKFMSDVVQRAFDVQTRRGLCWYEPKTRDFRFSASAKTHYQFDEFDNMPASVEGWVRGAVVSKDGSNYVLVYVCDFLGEPVSKSVLQDIYKKIQEAYSHQVCGIISEEGVLLLEEDNKS